MSSSGRWRLFCISEEHTRTLGNPESTLLSTSALLHYLLILFLVFFHRILCSIPHFCLCLSNTVTEGHQPPCVAAGPVAVPILSLLTENVRLPKLIWIHKVMLQEGRGRERRRRKVGSIRRMMGEKDSIRRLECSYDTEM